MAGKKGGKTEARAPARVNGSVEKSILDQARALTTQSRRSMIGLPSGLEPLALAPPEPSHTIQEQNLKAALESASIFVETLDADASPAIEEIEREVAFLSPYVQREVLHHGRGFSAANPIMLPSKVTPEVLQLLLQYCRFHQASGRSDKERKMFDERFVRLDTRRLCELTSAADALDMKPLVDLTSRALARLIEGKTPEQIRAQFQLPDDLTEEEKLEPVRNFGDDPKIRLLNRLYEKKRKELQRRRDEEEKLKKGEPVLELEGPPAAQPDNRPLDELLSFIDGSAGAPPAKAAKKKRSKGAKKQPLAFPASATIAHEEGSNETAESKSSHQNGGVPAKNATDQKQAPTDAADIESTTCGPDHAASLQQNAGPKSKRGQRDINAAAASTTDSATEHAAAVEAAVKWSDEEGEEDEEEEEEEDGTLDDIDEEDDGDAEEPASSQSTNWQVQHDGLLMHSASFGPILGPITTLTSLANFKARSLPTPRANAEAEPAACSNEVPAEPDSTAGPEESPTGEAPVSRAANNRMAASKHAEEAAAAQLEASVLQQSGSAHEESGSARSRGLSRSSLPNCDASGAGDAAPLAAASAQRAFGATAAGSEEQPDGGSKPASGSVQATASQVPQVGSGTGEASAQLRFVREASCAGGSASARGLAALLNGLPTTAGPPLSTSTHNSRDASPSVPARRGVSADARSQGDQPLQNHQQAVHRDGRKAHAQDKPSGVEAVRFENGGLSEETLGHRSRVHRKCNGFDAQSPSDVTTKSAQLVWEDPADVAAACVSIQAFLEQCGLSRHLQLVPVHPVEPTALAQDQAKGEVVESTVLPNQLQMLLSLRPYLKQRD